VNIAGIEALGIHIPRWSLDREALAQNWSAKSAPGARTVANFDEDSLTMGVEAALRALGPDPSARDGIDAVLFATTTPVFTEKQHAAVVAAALRIPADQCVDLTGSLRSGLDAVRLACGLIRGGTARHVLVIAADRRDLQPGGPHERLSGDAGAAVVVGTGPSIVSLIGQATFSDPAAGIWRSPEDRWSRVADDRFVTTELLTPWLAAAAGRACTMAGFGAEDLHAAAFAAPLARVEASVSSRLGLTVPSPSGGIDRDIGYTGVAHPFLQLALSLTDRLPGERVLIAAAGDGATALLGTVSDHDGLSEGASQMAAALRRRRELPVGMYQRMRGQLPVEPVNPSTSEMLLRREQSVGLELRGTRCRKCGRGHFPPRRICLECHTVDLMDTLELPRNGALFTHTVEHLFPVPVNELIMGVVDVGDVRVYTQVTDTAPDECGPGRPVDLVLRKLHDGGHLPHYFWKAKVVS
jgi:hydroxymethylglutaryl-CoA synthase